MPPVEFVEEEFPPEDGMEELLFPPQLAKAMDAAMIADRMIASFP